MTTTSLNYVSEIEGLHVVVRCEDNEHRDLVRDLGAKRRPLFGAWQLDCNDDGHLADVLSKLRDLGFSFAGGASGWPPAAIFEQLRERGLTKGTFREVVWRGPDQSEVRSK